MKNPLSILLAMLCAVCLLTGCGAAAAHDASFASSSAQAQETGQALSSEEQEREEDGRREEIEAQYSVYSAFGLRYDKSKDRFFYNGKVVRYFSDVIDGEHTNAFFYEDGEIDLNPVRNASGTLTGLTVASDEEFAARTANYAETDAAVCSSGASGSGAYEGGEPDAPDDSLEGYSEFGVAYDKTAKQWRYCGRPIYFFYDPKGTSYVDYSAADGVSVQVVRDKNQTIQALAELEKDEVERLLK